MKCRIKEIHQEDSYYYDRKLFIGEEGEVKELYADLVNIPEGYISASIEIKSIIYPDLPQLKTYFFLAVQLDFLD
jgi:hypothetical protein